MSASSNRIRLLWVDSGMERPLSVGLLRGQKQKFRQVSESGHSTKDQSCSSTEMQRTVRRVSGGHEDLPAVWCATQRVGHCRTLEHGVIRTVTYDDPARNSRLIVEQAHLE